MISFISMHSITFKIPVSILTNWISISRVSPMSLKPYYKYHWTSIFCIVYKYVFVLEVKSNIYILSSYFIPCDVLCKWGYRTSPYSQDIPCLYLFRRVFKTFQLLQVQIMSRFRVILGDHHLPLLTILTRRRFIWS